MQVVFFCLLQLSVLISSSSVMIFLLIRMLDICEGSCSSFLLYFWCFLFEDFQMGITKE